MTHDKCEQGQRRSARAPKRSRQHEDYTDNDEEEGVEPEAEEPELSSDRAEQVTVPQLVKCSSRSSPSWHHQWQLGNDPSTNLNSWRP